MKVLKKIWVYLKPFTNWRFLISFGLAWMVTNGWCYVFIVLGSVWKIKWMLVVGMSYASFLYLPFTIEKIITIPLGMFFQRVLFKNDMKLKAISDFKAVKYKMWCIYRYKEIKRLEMQIIGFNKGVYYERVKNKIYNKG
jgi:hypothetical protein